MKFFRQIATIGEAKSLNWRTHLIFALPAFLTAAFFDFERLGGDPLRWFGLALVGIVVTVSVIELLVLVTRKRNWKRSRPIIVLLILGVAGAIRGFVLFELGTELGIVPQSEFEYRVLAAPIFVISIYFIVNLVVASFLEHRDQLRKLAVQKANLVKARDGFEQEIQRLTDAQRAQVRELVAPSIWELQKHLSPTAKNIQDAIFELKSLNETIVRPLSREFSSPANVASDTTAITVASGNTKTRILPETIRIRTALDPVFFGFTTVLVSLSGQTVVLGVQSALILVAFVTSATMLLFSLFRFVMQDREIRGSSAIALTVYVGAGIGALTGGLAQYLGLAATQFFYIQASLFIAINMLLTLLVGSAAQARERSLEQLRTILEDLELLNSTLRQRVWLVRKSLAMELHGSIQSTLQSVAAKLAKAENPDQKLLNESLEQIREAFEHVGNEDYLLGKELSEVLNDLEALWDGALDLQIELSADAKQALEQDLAAARCVLEVCREAVTNAAKHGQAEQVIIDIGLSEEGVLIRATNDGVLANRDGSGQGTNLYNEVSHRYALTNIDGGVELRMLLPITRPA